MKVSLTVSLDIPGAESFSNAELRQIVFDEYTNYVAISHLEDLMKWTVARGKYESAGDIKMMEGCDPLIRLHRTWADIADGAEIVSLEPILDA